MDVMTWRTTRDDPGHVSYLQQDGCQGQEFRECGYTATGGTAKSRCNSRSIPLDVEFPGKSFRKVCAEERMRSLSVPLKPSACTIKYSLKLSSACRVVIRLVNAYLIPWWMCSARCVLNMGSPDAAGFQVLLTNSVSLSKSVADIPSSRLTSP